MYAQIIFWPLIQNIVFYGFFLTVIFFLSVHRVSMWRWDSAALHRRFIQVRSAAASRPFIIAGLTLVTMFGIRHFMPGTFSGTQRIWLPVENKDMYTHMLFVQWDLSYTYSNILFWCSVLLIGLTVYEARSWGGHTYNKFNNYAFAQSLLVLVGVLMFFLVYDKPTVTMIAMTVIIAGAGLYALRWSQRHPPVHISTHRRWQEAAESAEVPPAGTPPSPAPAPRSEPARTPGPEEDGKPIRL